MKVFSLITLSLLMLVSCIDPQADQTALEGIGQELDSDGIKKCLRSNPSISANFLELASIAGGSVTYSLNVKDNNVNCGSSVYSLENSNLNSALSLDLPKLVSLESGEAQVFTVNIAVANSIAVGNFSFQTKLTDTSSSLFNVEVIL